MLLNAQFFLRKMHEKREKESDYGLTSDIGEYKAFPVFACRDARLNKMRSSLSRVTFIDGS